MAYYGYFQNAIAQLDAIGLTDVLLPFFLVFTIVFAILQRSKLLGEESKKFNVIVALVVAFAVIIPHITGAYPSGADVVDIINRAIPNVSMVLVAILMVLLLIGIFGYKAGTQSTIQGWIALLAFLLVIFIFGAAANLWHIPSQLSFLLSPETQALIVVLLIFGLVVWFITKEEDKTHAETLIDKLGKWLGGSGGHGGH